MAGNTYPLGGYQPRPFPDQKSYLTRLQHVERLMAFHYLFPKSITTAPTFDF